jgi:hypothetical protein
LGTGGERFPLTLNHGDPSFGLVRNFGLTAQAHDLWVLDHARIHPRERVREHLGIRINAENRFVAIRTDASNSPERIEEFVFKRRHPLVEHDLLQERHQYNLRVSFSTISWFGVMDLERVSDLCNEDDGDFLLFRGLDRRVVIVVISSVHFCHVVAFVAVGDSDVRMCFDFLFGDDELPHHAENDVWRRKLGTGPLDHAVGDHENNLVTVWVIGGG